MGKILIVGAGPAGMMAAVKAAENGARVTLLENVPYPRMHELYRAADALILPYQGRSDLATCGWAIVERLRPKAVYLDHWDDSFPPLTATVDTRPFIDLLTSRDIPCRALVPLEPIDL